MKKPTLIAPSDTTPAKNNLEEKDAEIILLRKEIENLKELNHQYARKIDALNEVSIIAFTDPKGKITYVNNKFCQISGYKRQELIGKDHRILNSGFHSKEFFKNMWSTISAGKIWRAQIRNKNKNGGYYWVDTTIVPFLDKNGKIEEYIAIRNDITDEKNAEQQLINSSKLSSLGVMAGGIAHEINNPLAIIQGKVESITYNYLDNPLNKKEILSDLEKINSTVDRISNIIKGLRLFSRSAEKDPYVNTNLMTIIEETLGLCYERFNTNGIPLMFNTDDKEIYIDCRSTEVSQVILNLLNNAFDAVVNLKERWVQIDVDNQDTAYVKIRITDSGHGISNDLTNKIMEPFFTTKAVGKGTGLGLSISKGIIEDHKGELFINNNSPNTQFIISLPKPPKR